MQQELQPFQDKDSNKQESQDKNQYSQAKDESEELSFPLDEKKNFTVSSFEERFELFKCAYISDDIADHIFYSCTCMEDVSSLVCRECMFKCHQGLGHKHTKVPITGKNLCNCGENNHKMKQKKDFEKNTDIIEKCYFEKLLRFAVPRFKIRNEKNFNCYLCHIFNINDFKEMEEIDKASVTTVSFNDISSFHCSIPQECDEMQSAVKFMEQFIKMMEVNNKDPTEIEGFDLYFLRKYLLDLNFNSLKVLEIDKIFAGDIIDHDLEEFFENYKKEDKPENIFSNSYFDFYKKCFITSFFLKNSRYTSRFDFFDSIEQEKIKTMMSFSLDLIQFEDDVDIWDTILENITNGFFLYYNCFYSSIYSFYLKYSIMFRTLTITNLTLIQRYYFLIESKKNLLMMATEEEVKDLEYWLKIVPNGLIDFMERIQSFKIHTIDSFIDKLNPYIYLFFKVFKFLIKFNLIDDLTIVRFFSVVEQIFDYNMTCIMHIKKFFDPNELNNNKLPLFIRLPRLDIILEIMFLSLFYFNDKICMSQLLNKDTNKNNKFVFIYDESNELIFSATTLFIVTLKFINYLKYVEHINNPDNVKKSNDYGTLKNTLIYEQLFNEKKNLKNMYDSHKINYLIKQVFELLIESCPKCKL